MEKLKNLRDKLDMIIIRGMQKKPGIDGILVTVGLCIIALVLCVFMQGELKTFIQTIVTDMTTKAKTVLTTDL